MWQRDLARNVELSRYSSERRYARCPKPPRAFPLNSRRSLLRDAGHTTPPRCRVLLVHSGPIPAFWSRNRAEPWRGGLRVTGWKGRDFASRTVHIAYFDKTAKFRKYLSDIASSTMSSRSRRIYADIDAVASRSAGCHSGASLRLASLGRTRPTRWPDKVAVSPVGRSVSRIGGLGARIHCLRRGGIHVLIAGLVSSCRFRCSACTTSQRLASIAVAQRSRTSGYCPKALNFMGSRAAGDFGTPQRHSVRRLRAHPRRLRTLAGLRAANLTAGWAIFERGLRRQPTGVSQDFSGHSTADEVSSRRLSTNCGDDGCLRTDCLRLRGRAAGPAARPSTRSSGRS